MLEAFAITLSISPTHVYLARKHPFDGEITLPGHLDANKDHPEAGEESSETDSD